MAKALYNKPTSNPFEALQHAEDEVETKATASKKPDAAVVPSPAERAAARQAANAQKEAEKETLRKKQETEALLEAQQGPLEGFQVQKGSQPRKADRDAAKKMTREDYEKNGGQLPQPPEGKKPQRQNDGTRENKERKPYQGNRDDNRERKPYQGNREGEPRQPYDGEKRQHKPIHQGGGRPEERKPPRGREFDKHSAGKTGNKFEAKKQGGGAANWGTPEPEIASIAGPGWGNDPEPVEKPSDAPGWGDESAQPTEPAAAAPGWGDENEPKVAAAPSAPASVEQEAPLPKEEKKEKRPPLWDEEEGYGKITFAEYEKVKAQKDAELNAKIGGTKAPRKVEAPTDMSKFVDYKAEFQDDKDQKLAAKKDQKKGQQKVGVKTVELNELFDFKGPGGRGGGRGGRGRAGDRPPRVEGQAAGEEKPRRGGYGQANRGQGGHLRVPVGAKQFPDLVPQNVPKQTK
jgi:hypothetical protein